MVFTKQRTGLAVALIGLSVSLPGLQACSFIEHEEEVALGDVPDNVISTALQALPGLQLYGAELEKENGEWRYELTGKVDDTSYELEISPAGELLELETESDEDADSGE